MTPIDYSPIYVAFFTQGTIYEREAQRLKASLDLLGLPHDIIGIEDRHDWATNASQTARFCREMLEKHFFRPVVYLDADAVVRKFPAKFYEMEGVDLAAHWVNGSCFANGTVYWGKGPISSSIARTYETLVNKHGGTHPNEQKLLEEAILEHRPGARIERLPASYCWIEDICRDGLADDQIVIQHLQASRERHGGDPLANRRRWVAAREAT